MHSFYIDRRDIPMPILINFFKFYHARLASMVEFAVFFGCRASGEKNGLEIKIAALRLLYHEKRVSSTNKTHTNTAVNAIQFGILCTFSTMEIHSFAPE